MKSFRFNLQELGGALGDLGTLVPLMVGLILINGLDPTLVLAAAGIFYIVSGIYFRIPTPVQPLKVVSAIAISLGLSASVIGAAGLLMGGILLVLSLTNLISKVVKLFPKAVVRGIQLSIGLILFRKGIELVMSEQTFISGTAPSLLLNQLPVGIILAILALTVFILFKYVFFKQSQRYPPSLALLTFGLGVGVIFAPIPGISKLGPTTAVLALPSAADFWLAFTVLVIPQMPLTLGNSVVGTCDTAKTYFKDGAKRVNPRALTTSIGLANIITGLIGAMPMCHGSGGLTAHYKMGARTGGSNLMIGGLLLVLGLSLGYSALPFLSMIPLAVLGVLLAIVGIYHVLIVRDLKVPKEIAVAVTVTVVTLFLGNLAFGFGAGIILYHLLKLNRKTWSQFQNRISYRQQRYRWHSKLEV